MKSQTLAPRSALTRQQLRELRAELEREKFRYDAHDPRGDAIGAALHRMDDGTYGICLTCDGAIPYARLSVMPETQSCVACGVRS